MGVIGVNLVVGLSLKFDDRLVNPLAGIPLIHDLQRFAGRMLVIPLTHSG
jgi:hypothetical protein